MSEPFPSVLIRNFRIDLNENKALSESVFTRRRQVLSLAAGTADRWEGVISTPALFPADVRTMVNFLVKVGLYGRFTIPHPDYSGPVSGETSASVVGGSHSGLTLPVDGLTPSTLVMQEGDWFQFGDEFKRMTADATTNGSGEVTLNFKPAIRVSPADNDPVNLSTPVLLAELMSLPSEDTDELGMQAFTIAFQEALIHE